MITNRTAKRIDFSSAEVAYMRHQATLPHERRDSYASIARYLGREFADYNGGFRSRQAVYEFMNSDPLAPVILRIGIDRELLQRFQETGEDLQEWIISQMNTYLKGGVCSSGNSVPEENVGSVAALSDSPKLSSPATEKPTSRSRRKRSAETAKSL